MVTRGWGYWTEAKLDILSAYLPAFALASKRASSVVYLDLFAGNEQNQRRDKQVDIKGSALRALEALPDKSHLVFFELPRVAGALEERLRSSFPTRDFRVVPGDSNETVGQVLDAISARGLRRAPAFAFVDPYSTAPLRWETLKRLADFKRDLPNKVEIWLLFYGSDLPRQLGQRSDDASARVTRTFGCEDWKPVALAREEGRIDAARARYEYANLMRWRLQEDLGYARTHALEIKNTSGAYLYHLLFATDNKAGDRIMADVYAKAASRSERMRLEAFELRRETRTGQSTLFAADALAELGADAPHYEPEPPTPPFGLLM